jgi:hypothetical protein
VQTKVRIVGESELGKKIAKCIEEQFEIKKRVKFGTVPYRYATKMPLGCSIYITVKGEKTVEVSEPELKTIYVCSNCGWTRPEGVKSAQCGKCSTILIPKVIEVDITKP